MTLYSVSITMKCDSDEPLVVADTNLVKNGLVAYNQIINHQDVHYSPDEVTEVFIPFDSICTVSVEKTITDDPDVEDANCNESASESQPDGNGS